MVKGRFAAGVACGIFLGAGTAMAEPAPQQEGNVAQTAPAPADEAESIADIMVTAQRRAERLQDVPIAVSAVSGASLGSSGVTDVVDLRVAVPALNISQAQGYAIPRLRGIGSTGRGPGVETAIATYVDGVYYASPAASLMQLSNIERVEVVKGPQGTLFGRNATGGLVQVVTRDPPREFSGNASISYGNYEMVRAEGYVGTGLGAKAAIDVSGYYSSQGQGWGTNRLSGNDIYDVDHDWGIRSKLLLEPTETTRIVLTGDYSHVRNSMNPFSTAPGTLGYDGLIASYGERYDANLNADPLFAGWQGGGSLKIDQEIGDLTLVSITAYRDSSYRRQFDLDGSPADYQRVRFRQTDDQFSQELQLQSGGGPLTWQVGAYYFLSNGAYAPTEVSFGSAAIAPPPPGLVVTTFGKVKTKSLAGYAQGTWEFMTGTSLTLGLRYTDETKSLSGTVSRTLNGAPFPTPVPAQQPDVQTGRLTFRISLDHKFTPDILGYVSMNRGYRSGGFNAVDLNQPGYGPETLDAYEVGLKSTLFDRALTLNIAAFRYEYSGIQIQRITPAGTTVINGPSARITGLDADFRLRVSSAFSLSGGLTWIDDKFKRFLAEDLVTTPLGNVFPFDGDLTGNRLPLTSRFTASLAPEYRWDLGDGSVLFKAAYYYNSGFYGEPDNVVRQDAFHQLNSSIGWTMPGEKVTLTAWGKNLTDEQVASAQVTVGRGNHAVTWQAPRTYGVTLGVKF